MTKAQLEKLAGIRLEDAKALLSADRWAAAYYLLGYCIECALKACAAKQLELHEVPDREFINSFYTHSFDKLVKISGIKLELEEHKISNPNFAINWNTVRNWNETRRYEFDISEAMAQEMYTAMIDNETGVLPWLKTRW